MPQDASQQTPPPAPTACPGVPRHRDPPIYTGADDTDVDEWLTAYDRVGDHNKWDEAAKLSHVLFYLAGVASLWYNNHQAEFQTWSEFKTSLADVFGRPAVRKLRAEQRLRERAQQPGETFTSYIEDVLDLCRKVDSTMAESDRIRNILKGIEDDAFNMLLAKSPRSVAEIVTLCQSYEELRRQRSLTRRSLPRDEHLAGLSAMSNQAALLAEMKAFVREEVARQLSLMDFAQPHSVHTPTPSFAPPLRRVIAQELHEVLPEHHQRVPAAAPHSYAEVMARPQQMPTAAPLSYAEVVTQPQPLHQRGPLTYAEVLAMPRQQPAMQSLHQAPRPTRPSTWMGPPATTRWRTADNRPICFACGYAGHVARYCSRVQSPSATPYGPSSMASSPRPYYDDEPRAASPPFRRSANIRRSTSPRRRSPSPMRPRPEARDEEN